MKFELSRGNKSCELKYLHNVNSYSSATDQTLHTQKNYEIFCILSGDAVFQVENSVYKLHSGDILIINDKEIHKYKFNSESFEFVQIFFSPEIISTVLTDNFAVLTHSFTCRINGNRNVIKLSESSFVEALVLIKSFDKVVRSEEIFMEIELTALLIQLLLLLSRSFMEITGKPEKGMPYPIDSIIKHINSNLESDLSLKFLEDKFFISRYHLAHKFKDTVGISIYQYIMQQRIIKAKEYLSIGYSPFDVSSMLGFKQYSSFFKNFKKFIGINPTEYIHRVKEGSSKINSEQYSRTDSNGNEERFLSDLIVIDIFWIPDNPVEDDEVEFYAVVKNIGNAPTPNGIILGVGFCIDDITVCWSDYYRTPLMPGDTAELSANTGIDGKSLWKASAGTFKLAAYVNDMKRFKELHYTNNTLSKKLNVKKKK